MNVTLVSSSLLQSPPGEFIADLAACWCSTRIKSPEYSEDPVSLGKESPVHHGEAQAHTEPLEGAAGHARLGQQEEGVEEAEEDPSEKNVAEFSPCS